MEQDALYRAMKQRVGLCPEHDQPIRDAEISLTQEHWEGVIIDLRCLWFCGCNVASSQRTYALLREGLDFRVGQLIHRAIAELERVVAQRRSDLEQGQAVSKTIVEDGRIPDSIEPLVGWRWFRACVSVGEKLPGRPTRVPVSGLDKSLLRNLDGIELESIVKPAVWPRGKEMVASCWGAHGYVRHTGQAAPAQKCSCGIYALENKSDLISRGIVGFPSPLVFVLGEIYQWGKIVPGALGNRSQYAYPKKFVIPIGFENGRLGERAGHLVGKALFDAYKVEYELVPMDELYSSMSATRQLLNSSSAGHRVFGQVMTGNQALRRRYMNSCHSSLAWAGYMGITAAISAANGGVEWMVASSAVGGCHLGVAIWSYRKARSLPTRIVAMKLNPRDLRRRRRELLKRLRKR